jgi:hypothetical protein
MVIIDLTEVIGIDAGGGIDCGCWWLVVELRKCKVKTVTYLAEDLGPVS